MARKSREQIETEMREKQEEINREAEKRLAAMLPNLMAGLIAELGKAREAAGPIAAPATPEGAVTTKAVLEGLAHAMAKASDPANKRRILAPEVVEERALAFQEMKRAILQNHATGEVPVYRVVRATFLNETLVQPQFMNSITKAMEDQEIDWPGIPNQAMDPISESAKVVHAHYLKWIGARAGHVYMGFKLGDDREIEPNAVPFDALPAPMVLTGKEIRRGHAGAPAGAQTVHDAMVADPRRGNPAAKPRVERVLGTTAPPAVIG